MNGWVLTVERRIEAPPEEIFSFLSDPSNHTLIDGSGMLQGHAANDGEGARPEALVMGATFGMSMRMGMRYTTTNRVVEFVPGRRIAWQTGPTGTIGRYVAGRIWRYELEPVEGGSMVRESWDITHDHQRILLKLGGIYSGKTRRDMERTLARLEAVMTGSMAAD